MGRVWRDAVIPGAGGQGRSGPKGPRREVLRETRCGSELQCFLSGIDNTPRPWAKELRRSKSLRNPGESPGFLPGRPAVGVLPPGGSLTTVPPRPASEGRARDDRVHGPAAAKCTACYVLRVGRASLRKRLNSPALALRVATPRTGGLGRRILLQTTRGQRVTAGAGGWHASCLRIGAETGTRIRARRSMTARRRATSTIASARRRATGSRRRSR